LIKKVSITADQEEVHYQPSGKFAGLVWSFGLNNPSMQVQPIFNQSQGDTWHLMIFEHPQTLRNFFCLTKGDTIMIMYNNKFYLNVLETGPSYAISIFETDCEVDFAPPLDYQEPERVPVNKHVMATTKVEEQAVEDDVKFKPFFGEARRLDGRFSMESAALDCSARLKQISLDEANEKSKATQSNLRNKLVFGSNAAAKESKKLSKEDMALKKVDEKFQPFTSKSYRLSG
jgi:ubiquitin fusion degradation protein 1